MRRQLSIFACKNNSAFIEEIFSISVVENMQLPMVELAVVIKNKEDMDKTVIFTKKVKRKRRQANINK